MPGAHNRYSEVLSRLQEFGTQDQLWFLVIMKLTKPHLIHNPFTGILGPQPGQELNAKHSGKRKGKRKAQEIQETQVYGVEATYDAFGGDVIGESASAGSMIYLDPKFGPIDLTKPSGIPSDPIEDPLNPDDYEYLRDIGIMYPSDPQPFDTNTAMSNTMDEHTWSENVLQDTSTHNAVKTSTRVQSPNTLASGSVFNTPERHGTCKECKGDAYEIVPGGSETCWVCARKAWGASSEEILEIEEDVARKRARLE